jgi:prepilin-type processing-associated H-X9-DG protein
MYAQDYDERMWNGWNMNYGQMGEWNITDVDPNDGWWFYIYPYVKNNQIYYCPSGSGSFRSNHYGCNYHGVRGQKLAAFEAPAETFMIFDSHEDWIENTNYSDPNIAGLRADLGVGNSPPSTAFRHNEMANVAFMDGHVKALKQGAMLKRNIGDENLPWHFVIDD